MKCPDCGEEIKEILIERHLLKTFELDEEKRILTQVYPNEEWDEEEWTARCPKCGGDGVDDLISDYEQQEM